MKKVLVMEWNAEILKKIAKPLSEEALRLMTERNESRLWRKTSRQIALSVHYYLEEKGMSRQELSDKSGHSWLYSHSGR